MNKLDFDQILLVPVKSKINSRKDVNLNVDYTFKYSRKKYRGVPIMATNMSTIGTIRMARELIKHECITLLHKFIENKKISQGGLDYNFVGVSCGLNHDELEWKKNVIKSANFLLLDVANGYTENFIEFVSKTRDKFPEKTIIAGNVCTPEGVEHLIKAGADIVRVGIGSGGVCTTRLMTGVGYPQFSAILECGLVAEEYGAHIISDGGCKTPGDIAKAFAAGADFVCLGSMLAGHDECEGYISITESGESVMKFYGMSSKTAQNKFYGESKEYRASEGRTAMVPYKGPVSNSIREILGGLRSSCTYLNAKNLEDLLEASYITVNDTHNRIFENYTVGI